MGANGLKETTREDRLAALNRAIVVAGHKKPDAPDSPSTIRDTRRYLQDFDRVQKTATSDQELFDQMTDCTRIG
jgi:hypothetical protein